MYYADETQVSEEGYVPYGWQFKDENICIRSAKGKHINCFGMLNHYHDFVYETTTQMIDSDFIIEQLDKFSFSVTRHTVVVMDNAKVHRSNKIKERQPFWARRNLFIFFLPPYSPHLNKIERLWKEIKARWLEPKDYETEQQLSYTTKLILQAVGKNLFLQWKPHN